MNEYQLNVNGNELREIRIAVKTRIEFLENLIEDLKNIDDKEQSDIDDINELSKEVSSLNSVYNRLLRL